ncbi:MAG: sigma-70 family RNA polymerase sigma factor [Peptococcaceae bacterium]|nr:sigma-70 family RNA polymerase sigma factor [Peptococcaceae bacterium]
MQPEISYQRENPIPAAAREDKELAASCGRGDADAFEILVSRYEKRIYAMAVRFCGNLQEGEDLAQETFLKAWKAIGSYRGQAAFSTWLAAILTNLWRDRLRKKPVATESLDQKVEVDDGSLEKQVADQGPGPEELLESKEEGRALRELVGRLKPEYREALVLRDIQGYSYEEVAVITGQNLGTVKSRINRARTFLREEILRCQEQNRDFFRLSTQKGDKKQKRLAERREANEG